jgi:hypothetical protein
MIQALLIITVVSVMAINIFQPEHFECGINLQSLHLILYSMIFLVIGVIMLFADLMILYFLKMSKDKKIGFLLHRKKTVS